MVSASRVQNLHESICDSIFHWENQEPFSSLSKVNINPEWAVYPR